MTETNTNNDKYLNDSFELYTTKNSKFDRDISKDGVRSFAAACLDDFVRIHMKRAENVDFEILYQNTDSKPIICIYWYQYDLNGNINEPFAYTVYNGDKFAEQGSAPYTERQKELLIDLLRIAYKYEYNHRQQEINNNDNTSQNNN